MLIIRDEQMAAFRQHRVEQFTRRLEASLKRLRPDLAATPPETLEAFIRAGMERARIAGVYLPEDLIGLFAYFGQHGLEFGHTESTAWAAPILDDPHASGSEKLERLASAEPRPGEVQRG